MKFRRSKISAMARRTAQAKRIFQVDTQRIRAKLMKSLEGMFEVAEGFAKDKNLKLKQRQVWSRIAAYIGQVINSLAKSFDEAKISKQLDELERMIREGSGEEAETA